jgi:hypothetical protein
MLEMLLLQTKTSSTNRKASSPVQASIAINANARKMVLCVQSPVKVFRKKDERPSWL